MGFLDSLKGLFGGDSKKSLGRLNVAQRFRLSKHAFTGTMSNFRVATEIETGKTFGIKFLDKEKTKHFADRFKGLKKPNEGQIAMKIVHPNVVETYEFGKTTTGEEYILMEYIDGPGLNSLIKVRSPELNGVRIRLITQMALALQAVHDAGFIHRDICPRNYLCDESLGKIKLIDFGLTVPDEAPYRLPGNRTGTPQYMAPEIVRRRATDHRVDVFSFGITVYRMLTFEHPWGSTDTTGKAALAHDNREPTPITNHLPEIHERLAQAVHRCLLVKAEKRFDNLKSFIAMIKGVDESGCGKPPAQAS